jgi:GTPase
MVELQAAATDMDMITKALFGLSSANVGPTTTTTAAAAAAAAPSPFASLAAQLRKGQGEVLVDVAETSLAALEAAAAAVGDVRVFHVAGTTYCVRAQPAVEGDFTEVRVAVLGNVDAGKSTTMGVLTHGELDNGNGRSRLKIFRFRHEAETGRTSAVSTNILGFASGGEVVNRPAHDGTLDWVQICTEAAKIINFIDLAGHEKYLKTTVAGLTGRAPDYAMLMVGANSGLVGMTKEHLGLSLALNMPVFVVVTKIDMCPPNVRQDTLKLLQRVLKSPGCRKMPLLVHTAADAVAAAESFVSQRVCPVFQVSNVTGDGLDSLRLFLNLLKTRNVVDGAAADIAAAHANAEFHIDETYSVPGVGTVVSGLLARGVVRVQDTLLLGPDAHGTFQLVGVKSIQRQRFPCEVGSAFLSSHSTV